MTKADKQLVPNLKQQTHITDEILSPSSVPSLAPAGGYQHDQFVSAVTWVVMVTLRQKNLFQEAARQQQAVGLCASNRLRHHSILCLIFINFQTLSIYNVSFPLSCTILNPYILSVCHFPPH